MTNNYPIIIVGGEPNSIFSEILVKSFNKIKKDKPIILFASYKLLLNQIKALKLNCNFNLLTSKNINKHLNQKKINIYNIDYKFKKPFEKISKKSNKYIANCFLEALNFSKKNKIAGLINGPVSKKFFLGKNFLGITEYLALKTKSKNYAMLIYNKKISVSPITTHLPINYVSNKLNKNSIVEKTLLINKFLKFLNKKKPKIAVTGLNPHCENFFYKSEEKKIIEPAIKYLSKKNIDIHGPFSADTIFLKKSTDSFDAIIGMYHDQVLAPIKALTGFDAINITLGLPFLRITPDHGPNEEMQGKNKSNFQSMLLAINFLKQIK